MHNGQNWPADPCKFAAQLQSFSVASFICCLQCCKRCQAQNCWQFPAGTSGNPNLRLDWLVECYPANPSHSIAVAKQESL